MDKNTETLDSIKFKPMSEGLGLNHFADGLPYTPAQSRRKPMVSFNFPPPRAPKGQEPSPARRVIEEFDLEAPLAAGFIRRVVAYGLDVTFATVMFYGIVWASFALNGFNLLQLLTERRGVQMFWPLALLYVVVYMGYFLIQETTWRRTLGKSMMGIRIQSESGFATLGRAVCFFIAAVPFGVGLVWYFFDSKRRCWHDVITDSEVVTIGQR